MGQCVARVEKIYFYIINFVKLTIKDGLPIFNKLIFLPFKHSF